VIPKVGKRGRRVGGLLRYLFGPGKFEEHVNPRLVASWRGTGALAQLDPPVGADGKRDFRSLVALLEQPVRAARNPPRLTVWHCSVDAAPEDRYLTDAQWAHIAAEVMAAVGLAPAGDDRAVRWVAVRHSDRGIHLVATLVRQDGRTAWAWKDKLKAQAACRDIEQRYGLRRVGPTDRTAARRPGMEELIKARRQGRTRTARDELRQRVRTAVAGSASEGEFVARLRDAGLLVEFRESSINPGERTGYRVALPAYTTADGLPVWYSGGKLAADLSLPRLRRRWADPAATTGPAGATVRVSQAARAHAMAHAAAAVQAAAEEIRRIAHTDPAAAQAAAQAASDILTAVASTVDGRAGGPLTRAAEVFDRAARDLYGRVARATSRAYEMRAMSRLVYLMGRISGDEDTYTVLALVLDLARLSDTLAWLREAQQRYHQAQAARQAAAMLREAATGGGRLVTPVVTVPPTPVSSMEGGRVAPRAAQLDTGARQQRPDHRPNR
jgi:hypothetical protein